MKLKTLLPFACSAILTFGACESAKEPESLREMEIFITDIKDQSEEDWNRLEEVYKQKQAATKAQLNTFNEEQKDDLEKYGEQFYKMKAQAEQEALEKKSSEVREPLENESFTTNLYYVIYADDGDLMMEEINANNITAVYRNYLKVLKKHESNLGENDKGIIDQTWVPLENKLEELRDQLSQDEAGLIEQLRTDILQMTSNI